MKKYFILLSIFTISCHTLNVFRNIQFTDFNIEYDKPIYYQMGNKIYYSKDIYISSDDRLISGKSYRGGHVSPDYNYIVTQGENAVELYDKNGNKIKEFKDCFFDYLQWSPDSKKILLLTKVKKEIHLSLYNISTNKVIVIHNKITRYPSRLIEALNNRSVLYNEHLEFNDTLAKFLFSKNSRKIYIIEMDTSVQVYDIKKQFKTFLFNIISYKVSFRSNEPNYLELEKKYQTFINDLFIYLYKYNYRFKYPHVFSSYDLKKYVFYRYLKIVSKNETGFWLFENNNYRQILSMENEISTTKTPLPFAPAPSIHNTYFLPDNRYFVMPLYLENYYGYIIYDTKNLVYKELFARKDVENIKKKLGGNIKPYMFYNYFTYLFPVTSNDTPIDINFQGTNIFYNKFYTNVQKFNEFE